MRDQDSNKQVSEPQSGINYACNYADEGMNKRNNSYQDNANKEGHHTSDKLLWHSVLQQIEHALVTFCCSLSLWSMVHDI